MRLRCGSGVIGEMGDDNILKLAEALDVTPAELFRPLKNGDSM